MMTSASLHNITHALKGRLAYLKKIIFQIYYKNNYLQVGFDRLTPQSYRDLLTKLPSGSQSLINAYDSIDKKIKDVSISGNYLLVYLF